jgi:hypothetical protein
VRYFLDLVRPMVWCPECCVVFVTLLITNFRGVGPPATGTLFAKWSLTSHCAAVEFDILHDRRYQRTAEAVPNSFKMTCPVLVV